MRDRKKQPRFDGNMRIQGDERCSSTGGRCSKRKIGYGMDPLEITQNGMKSGKLSRNIWIWILAVPTKSVPTKWNICDTVLLVAGLEI